MNKIKAYKVTNPDYTCRGFKYNIGESYHITGGVSLCNKGFHACRNASDCFNYYSFNHNNKVLEVELYGEVIHSDDKSVASSITIIRELSWEEMLRIVNSGSYNSGYKNSGDYNSGNCNSGYKNSGGFNSGHSNSGDSNSGDFNSGNYNSGHNNSGNYNSGNYNSGYKNSGDYNSGHCNSGNYNSGNYNSGYKNSGDFNSGHSNSGKCNSGHSNSGNCNSGSYNSGHSNSGSWNSGHCNSGFFNTTIPKIRIFNKYTSATEIVFPNIFNFDTVVFIPENKMTDEEKLENKDYETKNGYYKHLTLKEAWANALKDLSEENRQKIINLPNYDPDVFEEITGVRVE